MLMLSSIVAVMAVTMGLIFGQGDSLRLFNARATHGLLGPDRSEDKVLPGDQYWVAFDIEGVHTDPGGQVSYTMAMDLTNKEGKVIYSQEPKDLNAVNSLGGTRMQGFTYIQVGLRQPAGEYTINVTFTDRNSKAVQTLHKKFEVMPADFGLVNLGVFADPDGRIPAPPQGVTGQPLTIVASAVGFSRDAKAKQPSVVAELKIYDENGKPTLAKPFTFEVNQGVSESAPYIPFPFMIFLNRPGKFTVDFRATDRITKKTGKLSFPLTVTEQGTKEQMR
jgi:hypothetical protein